MSYFQQQEESQIRAEYKYKRVNEELLEMNVSEAWKAEAIENFAIVDNGNYKKLLLSAIDTHDSEDVLKYLMNVRNSYFKENAEIIVDREMENMSVDDMQNYLDKKQDESPRLFANSYVRVAI